MVWRFSETAWMGFLALNFPSLGWGGRYGARLQTLDVMADRLGIEGLEVWSFWIRLFGQH